MAALRTKIDGRDVINEGSIVCKLTEKIELFPFENQPSYTLELRFALVNNPDDSKSITFIENGVVVLEYRHFFDFINEVIVDNIIFAANAEHIYSLSYYAKFLGDKNELSALVSYTVTRKNVGQ